MFNLSKKSEILEKYKLVDNQKNVFVLASASKELHQLALNKLTEVK